MVKLTDVRVTEFRNETWALNICVQGMLGDARVKLSMGANATRGICNLNVGDVVAIYVTAGAQVPNKTENLTEDQYQSLRVWAQSVFDVTLTYVNTYWPIEADELSLPASLGQAGQAVPLFHEIESLFTQHEFPALSGATPGTLDNFVLPPYNGRTVTRDSRAAFQSLRDTVTLDTPAGPLRLTLDPTELSNYALIHGTEYSNSGKGCWSDGTTVEWSLHGPYLWVENWRGCEEDVRTWLHTLYRENLHPAVLQPSLASRFADTFKVQAIDDLTCTNVRWDHTGYYVSLNYDGVFGEEGEIFFPLRGLCNDSSMPSAYGSVVEQVRGRAVACTWDAHEPPDLNSAAWLALVNALLDARSRSFASMPVYASYDCGPVLDDLLGPVSVRLTGVPRPKGNACQAHVRIGDLEARYGPGLNGVEWVRWYGPHEQEIARGEALKDRAWAQTLEDAGIDLAEQYSGAKGLLFSASVLPLLERIESDLLAWAEAQEQESLEASVEGFNLDVFPSLRDGDPQNPKLQDECFKNEVLEDVR